MHRQVSVNVMAPADQSTIRLKLQTLTAAHKSPWHYTDYTPSRVFCVTCAMKMTINSPVYIINIYYDSHYY